MKFLFPYEHVRRANRPLSGGERTRLKLLLLMRARPNLLALREPTNHLDRYFLDRVADRIVEVDGSVRATDGGCSAWLERRTTATG